ncbi:hypothetical protein C9975_05840 [Thalassospira xiamenensis]|nr:hypothetical protein C9975_05840 [Thalassospira xiamenensis]
MHLTSEGYLIMEVRRLFALGSVFGHSKTNTIEAFEAALNNQSSPKKLAEIVEFDAGLSALLIAFGNRTIRNTPNQNSALSVQQAINRIGVKGCLAALTTYRFEVLLRETGDEWRGVFKSALERSYRAASTSKAICTRLQKTDIAQTVIMITVLYATSVFAKIIAAQSLGLTRSDKLIEMIRVPSSILAEPVLMKNHIPYEIIRLVNDIDADKHETIEGRIAKTAWDKTLGNITTGERGFQA